MVANKEWTKKQFPGIPKEIEENFSNKWVQQRFVELNFQNLDSAKAFIDPDLFQPTDPRELPDLEKAANRIQKAILENESIGIWGDFDVDGQTSTTLLVQALRLLGADPRYHIPNRDKESHGIRLQNLKEFVVKPISLLITCDTGISEHDSIAFCNQNGIEVVITDHHALPSFLPDAFAIVNPQRLSDDHPLKTLAGVGTAYKLIEYLFKLFNKETDLHLFVDLVALGTIADVAVLSPENHYLVQIGIKKIKSGNRLLIKEILQKKEINSEIFNETSISFVIAPLLNALGRLDDAEPIVESFLSTNIQETRIFANILDNLNEKRKLITEQITDATLALIRKERSESGNSIVLHHPDWHPGVLGIVANRLVELFNKPVILLTGNPDQPIRGSGRSIDGVNIIEAIRNSSQILTHFGGHTMAAGLSLPFENLEIFKKEFDKSVQHQLSEKKISLDFMVDGFIDFNQISLDFVKELEILSPFGSGNPRFIFACKNVNIARTAIFGKNKQHLKFFTTDENNIPVELLWWQGANQSIPDTSIDIAFRPGKSVNKGQEQLQLEIVKIRPSENAFEKIKSDSKHLEIIDLRAEKHISIEKLIDIKDSFIWAEGLENKELLPFDNRLNQHPAENLIIYTCPPSLVEIAKVWKSVNPKKLYLCSVLPEDGSINSLVLKVSGMINLAIRQRSGVFELDRVAALTGQRMKTIRVILNYLEAKGKILIKEHPDTNLVISYGEIEDKQMALLYENQLRFLFQETRYFQKWYQKINAAQLMDEVVDLFSR